MKADEKTAVLIGLGQIGGSLALALKKAGYFKTVGGFDVNSDRLQKAGDFLDCMYSNLDEALSAGDLIILAAPVLENIRILGKGFQTHPDKLYTDVGSTKTQMMEESRKKPGIRFIGGHPFSGTEKEGDSGWDSNLFSGKPYFWVQENSQSIDDQGCIINMIKAIGAIPKAIDPEEHDRALALTSHLPILISLGLAGMLDEDVYSSDFIGSGFLSTTRIAGGSAELGRDILISNREAVLNEMTRFNENLAKLVESLENSNENQLLELMVKFKQRYSAISH